jgi:hypothetical protein
MPMKGYRKVTAYVRTRKTKRAKRKGGRRRKR